MDNISKTSKEYIDVTMEYTKRYNTVSQNRAVGLNHVNKLKEEMKHSLKNFPAINVNKCTNHIIDGQHRLRAFQELVEEGELPIDATITVFYSDMTKEEEIGAIIRANNNSKNWTLDDFVESYAIDNPEYRKLCEWGKNHSLCFVEKTKKVKYRYAAAILKGKNCKAMLTDGSFFISPDDFTRSEVMHDELDDILTALKKDKKGNYIEAIALSWSEVRTLHPFKEWVKELKLKKPTIDKKPYSNKKDWDMIFSLVSTSINIKNN